MNLLIFLTGIQRCTTEVIAGHRDVADIIRNTQGVSQAMGSMPLYTLGIPASGTTPAVPGFNTTTKEFVFRVNTAGVSVPSDSPYQGQIGARYSF